MNIQELIESIIYLPSDCSGLRPMIDKLTTLELIKLLDEPEKVKIPQFVANWIGNVKRNGIKRKNNFGFYEEITSNDSVYRVMYYIFKEGVATEDVKRWVGDNPDDFARAWLDGYEVEETKEALYTVTLKSSGQKLSYHEKDEEYLFSSYNQCFLKDRHTRKELENAGFGWVFNCESMDVQECDCQEV